MTKLEAKVWRRIWVSWPGVLKPQRELLRAFPDYEQ
jgi:hypothetical protein